MTTGDPSNESKSATEPRRDPVRRGTDRGVAIACVAALLVMGGMSFAAVPLYRMFCQATGFAGTPVRAAKAPDGTIDRVITIRFDANVAPGMPWTFQPVQRTIDVKVGENVLAFYRAHNSSDKPVTGSASFNVSPDVAGAYFSKIACFCFTEQTLAAGESVDMPVSFFVDPSIMKDRDADAVRDITLSYTFYPATGAGEAKVEVKSQTPKQGS